MKCPNCKKKITLQEATFCPYCSQSLLARKLTVLPTTAGILVIVAAAIALFIAVGGTILFADGINDYRLNLTYPGLALAIFGVIGLCLGLIAGIFSIKRRRTTLSTVSLILLLISGVGITLTTYVMYDLTVDILSYVGIAIVLLSTLSLFLLRSSKKEFS